MKAVVYTGDNSAEYTDADSPVVQDGQTRVGLSFLWDLRIRHACLAWT